MSIIEKIEEIHSVATEGYRIVCDDDTITVAISGFHLCCEDYGYLTTEDNIKRFIGAEVHSVERVIDPDNFREVFPDGLDEGAAMFVNINTNLGKLQLVVYNEHNGYYGHESVMITRGLVHREWL